MYICVDMCVCVYTYILRACDKQEIREASKCNKRPSHILTQSNSLLLYWRVYSVFHEKQKIKEVTQLTV